MTKKTVFQLIILLAVWLCLIIGKAVLRYDFSLGVWITTIVATILLAIKIILQTKK